MFAELDKLSEKFGAVFADKQLQMLSSVVNFHIGKAPNGQVCYDVNGANAQKVAEGYKVFEAALKKVGMIK